MPERFEYAMISGEPERERKKAQLQEMVDRIGTSGETDELVCGSCGRYLGWFRGKASPTFCPKCGTEFKDSEIEEMDARGKGTFLKKRGVAPELSEEERREKAGKLLRRNLFGSSEGAARHFVCGECVTRFEMSGGNSGSRERERLPSFCPHCGSEFQLGVEGEKEGSGKGLKVIETPLDKIRSVPTERMGKKE